MKTTIEIPDPLFRQAKARAALEGKSLRELFEYGLRLALQTPRDATAGKRAAFPLIRSGENTRKLTDEQVAAALNTDEDLG
jgi:hypothetical protein